jgi:ADP-heptose:LPS heptosyltransferase
MNILVIRTSAMGDAALVSPVLKEMKKQYPEVKITMLTRPAFKPFFTESDSQSVFSLDLVKRHKGLSGLFRLYSDIKKQGRIDWVIDLHDVIRSKILRFLFSITGIPVSIIDKGRQEKQDLIKGKRKVQLKHTVVRYSEVFAKAGFISEPVDKQTIIPDMVSLNRADEILNVKTGLKIGVAPYAKHKLKMWPEENMICLLNMISEKQSASFFLFGGKEEYSKMEEFKKKVKGSINLACMLSLEEEIAIISKLDFMIAMDSANMHMAALAGTKVFSIWGGTDPLAGFGAWKQPNEYSIRIPVEELTCRPCTIYGKGDCRRGDLACMNWLIPEIVFSDIQKTGLLEKSSFNKL